MVVFVFAETYGQFERFIRSTFPRLSLTTPIGRDVLYIGPAEHDVQKAKGYLSNTPYFSLGLLSEWQEALIAERELIQLKLADGK